jgi:hypothetical protein
MTGASQLTELLSEEAARGSFSLPARTATPADGVVRPLTGPGG